MSAPAGRKSSSTAPGPRSRPELRSHYRRWTAAEAKSLRLLWGAETVEEIAKKLGRSPLTVYYYADRLGLPRGCPQGYEYLTSAAKRTGFATDTLRAVLNAAGKAIRVAMAKPLRKGRGRSALGTHRTHVVVPDDVDEAVLAWTTEESLPAAAERLGTTRVILRAALVAAGHKPPRKKHRWRVMPAVADAAMATYRRGMSVRAHAARLGMSRHTLAGRLRKVGALGEKKGGVEVRLTSEAVDAALGAFEAQQNPRTKRLTRGERLSVKTS